MSIKSFVSAYNGLQRREPIKRQPFGRALPIAIPKVESYVAINHNKLGVN